MRAVEGGEIKIDRTEAIKQIIDAGIYIHNINQGLDKLGLDYHVVGVKLPMEINENIWTTDSQIDITVILQGVKVYYEKDTTSIGYLLEKNKKKD